MPKRTNPFQHLIALIETALAAEQASVRESIEVLDRITGTNREVDIVIELHSFHHRSRISVECKGGGKRPRPATIEWVEQMWGKHQSLPTDRLILVAKGGFTASARKKATWWEIECLTLEEAEHCDWNAKIRNLEFIEVIHFLLPYVTSAKLILAQNDDDSLDTNDINLKDPLLHTPDGEIVNATDQARKWINDPAVLQALQERAFDDAGTTFEFERRLKNGAYIEGKSGRRYQVVAIAVKGKCRKTVDDMRLAQKTYADAAVAHGATKGFGRKEVSFVLAERERNDPTVAISVRKENEKGS